MAIAVVGLSRLLDGPLVWLTAGLLAAAVAVGAAAFIAEGRALDAPIEGVILPALAAGKIVILDRYYYSTMAYQGARGADAAAWSRMSGRRTSGSKTCSAKW